MFSFTSVFCRIRCGVVSSGVSAARLSCLTPCVPLEARRSKRSPVGVIPETVPTHPLLATGGVRGPLINIWLGVNPFLPKQQFRGKGHKGGAFACLCIHLCILVCVCMCVCVCVYTCMYVYIRVKWPGQRWGYRADCVRGERPPLCRPPCPPLRSTSGATVWAAARPRRSDSIWTAVCLWQNPSSHTASGLICWWFQSPKQPGDTQIGHISTALQALIDSKHYYHFRTWHVSWVCWFWTAGGP